MEQEVDQLIQEGPDLRMFYRQLPNGNIREIGRHLPMTLNWKRERRLAANPNFDIDQLSDIWGDSDVEELVGRVEANEMEWVEDPTSYED